MFPKNRINIVYRLLCLISYIVVIYLINSFKTLLILLLAYFFLALFEKSFKNIELIIITLIILGICYLFDNYIAFKIMLMLDYIFYFLDTTYEEVKVNKKDYIRFKKYDKKKGSNNLIASFVALHLIILLLAIVVR